MLFWRIDCRNDTGSGVVNESKPLNQLGTSKSKVNHNGFQKQSDRREIVLQGSFDQR